MIKNNDKNNNITAAFIIIGDEILSGRTEDKNLHFLANQLTEIGIILKEVRVVADIENEIINAVNHLKSCYNYVFTSGGIGPTHDDITSLSISKAFGVKYSLNQQAKQILIDHYGVDGVNEARLKMAYLPESAILLDNSISAAPGFRIDNVFVMAGIPKIFQVMFLACKKDLITGNKIISKEIKTNLTESKIAKDFANLQQKYPQITMGSYPSEGSTSLVFRSTDYKAIDEAIAEMNILIDSLKEML